MAKIVCIVPRREMADQASLLAANMHIDDFSVIFAETEEIPTLAKSLAGVGIDVIIARGAQALMLRGALRHTHRRDTHNRSGNGSAYPTL